MSRIPGSSEGENGGTLFQVLQAVRLSQLLDEQLKFRIPLHREYIGISTTRTAQKLLSIYKAE
jgi:hypothetical protein